jgi:hypothetical protein
MSKTKKIPSSQRDLGCGKTGIRTRGTAINSTHDFQSCSFNQLGHLSYKKLNKIADAQLKVNENKLKYNKGPMA